jgi:hypothetical protein
MKHLHETESGVTPELAEIVAEVRSACVHRDAPAMSAGLTQLLGSLRQLDEQAQDFGRPREELAAEWLLTKSAENLRALERGMATRWDEAERTARLAERCVTRILAAV